MYTVQACTERNSKRERGGEIRQIARMKADKQKNEMVEIGTPRYKDREAERERQRYIYIYIYREREREREIERERERDAHSWREEVK